MKKIYIGSLLKSVFVLLLSVLCYASSNAQPWTYDFGTGTGTANNANSGTGNTTFFTGTPTNGGTYRVRIGTAGGSLVLANPGTTLGTFSEAQLSAATSTSTNKFGIYDWTTVSTVAYLKAKIRTTSAGNGNLAICIGNNTMANDNQGFTSHYNNSVASLRFTYSSGTLSVTRRTSGTDNAVTSALAKDADQDLEIYVNNGAASTTYTIGGTSYTLNSQQWDLWVGGTKISPANGWAKAGTLATGNLTGIGFFAESSTGNAAVIYLDDLEYSNALPTCTSQTITALSTPVTKNYGDVPYSVATTSTSGLTVAYASSNTAVATVDASGNVTIVGAGTANITASQAGNGTYCAATNSVQALTVNPKNLTITGLTANNKVFDGTTTATLSGTPSLQGIINSDNVTLGGAYVANFNDPTVGTGKPVTVSGYTLGGTKAGNYTLTQPTGLTADITAASNSIDLNPTTQTKGPYCNGTANSIALNFTKTGTVTAPFIQLSNSAGSFASGTTNLGGTVTGSGTFTITGSIPAATAIGTAYRVRIVSTDGTPVISLDNNSNITINASPTVPTSATPAAVCEGNAVTITGAGSTNATTYTYWNASSGGTQYTTGSPVGYTVTGGNLTTPSTLANGTYTYYIQGENAALCSGTTRQAVTVTINALPATPSNPVPAANPSCGPTTLGVITPAAGETYYWQGTNANGTSTAANTSATYAVTASGTYYVRARNNTTGCWSTASGSVAVVVNAAPSITTQPVDDLAYVGATSTFSVVATNVVSYQWQVSTDGGVIYNNVSTGTGGTTASYTTPVATLAMNGYKFQCILTGNAPCATVTTSAATWTVTTGPCISSDFPNTTLPAGWSGTSVNDPSPASHYQSAPYCRQLAGGADLITPATDNPTSINFYVDASGSGGQIGTLYYRIGAGGWISIGTFTATTAGATASFNLTSSPNLSTTANVSFRILSGSNSIYIDDLNVFCGPSTPTPAIAISQGATAIATGTGSYSFGNQLVSTSSAAIPFTVENNGTATLNLTGTPKVAISGNTADFTINQSTTSATVAAAATTSFTIAFNPTTTGTRTATISIANDDPSKNPYTFTITGNGTYATTSTITENGTSYNAGTPGTKIPYLSYQATPAVGGAVGGTIQVLNFNINDLGGDAQPTILSGISFTVRDGSNVDQSSQIRYACLATSANSIKAVGTISGGVITFTGLTPADFTAANGTSINYILRVSYNATGITDNTKFIFKVSTATASPSGSVFAAADAGGATSDVSADNRNRIDVAADRIVYGTQPATTSVNTNIPLTIRFVDINNNLDFDNNRSITLTASNGGVNMTSTSPYAITATHTGIVSVTNVQFTSGPQTNISITATTTGLTVNSVVSNLFDISIYNNGDFYSVAGTGLLWNNDNNWRKVVGGVLQAAGTNSFPNSGSTDIIFITAGSDMLSNGSRSAKRFTVQNGGSFTTSSGPCSVSEKLLVQSGGVYTMSNLVTVSGILEVEDNGTFNYAYNNTNSRSSSVWAGTEMFHENSNFVIKSAQNSSNFLVIEDKDDISLYNGACFGNVIIDMSAGQLQLLPPNFVKTLANGNLIFRNLNSNFRLGDGGFTSGVNGNFVIESTISNSITFLTTAGTATFAVKGNLTHSGTAALRLTNNNTSTLNVTLSVDGNMTINGAGSNFDMNGNTTAGNASTSTLNLKGNLLVNAASIFKSTNTANLGSVNFTGTGDGLSAATTQTIDIASTDATRNQYINFTAATGSYVQLANRNLELGRNSSFVVAANGSTGGTLDFGFAGATTTALNITTYTTGTQFYLGGPTGGTAGGRLKISSPQGISNTSGSVGNVQLTNAPTYNQVSTFHYIGRANQVTGSGIENTSSGRVVVCEMADNTLQLTPTNSFAVTAATTIGGGKLDVRKGQFIETATNYITGSSGTLYMSAGTLYKIAKGNVDLATSTADQIPRMTGSGTAGVNPYVLTGGTIELSGTGSANAFQTLRGSGSRPNYINVKYSGANTLGVDFKNLSSTTTIDSALIITGTAIVDCRDASDVATSFIGDAGIVMDGGRLRLKNSSTAQPQLDGNKRAYELTDGVVEFYNSNTVGNQPIRGKYGSPTSIGDILYKNIEVTGNKVGISTANITLRDLGTFIVKPTGVYEMSDNSIVGPTGTQTVTIENGGVFRTGNNQGFHGYTSALSNYSSVHANIENIVLAPGSTVNYMRTGAQPITNSVTTNNPTLFAYQNLYISGTGNKTAPTGDLVVLGDMDKSNTSVFVNNGGTVKLNGTTAQNITATLPTPQMVFNNLQVNNSVGVEVKSNFGVYRTLSLNSNGKLNFNAAGGDVTLASDASNTANVARLTGSAAINYNGSGRFIVERYIPTNAHGRTWQFLATPAQGAQTINAAWQEGLGGTATVLNGLGTRINGVGGTAKSFDGPTGVNIKTYIPSADQWTNGPTTTDTAVFNPNGWMLFVRGDRNSVQTDASATVATVLRTRGQLFEPGNAAATVPADVNVPLGKYQSAGNPYASSIDLRLLTQTNLTDEIYLWDPTLGGGYGFGKYRTITVDNGDYISSVGATTAYPVTIGSPINRVQSGQAFFVKAKPAMVGTLGFPATAKTDSSRLVNRGGIARTELLGVELLSKDAAGTEQVMDGAMAIFGDYSKKLDYHDAIKIMSNTENTAFRVENALVAVERAPSPETGDTLYLEVSGTRKTSYKWKVTTRDMDKTGRSAWIYDQFLKTNTTINLDGETTMDFDVTDDVRSAAADRFRIVFQKAIAAPLPVTFVNVAATRNPDRSINIKWTVANELNITKYTVERSADGLQFAGIVNEDVANRATYAKNDLSPLASDNFYRIKATGLGGEITYSNVVKVAPLPTKASISVHPNPVEGKTLRLIFTNQPAGKYQVQLLNKLGQTVYTRTVKVEGFNFVQTIQLNDQTARGTYELKVVNTDGKVSTQQLLIK